MGKGLTPGAAWAWGVGSTGEEWGLQVDRGSSRAGYKTQLPQRGALLFGLSLSSTWERPTKDPPLL